MQQEFIHSLEHVLRGFEKRSMREAATAGPDASRETAEARHRKWFAQFAEQQVMPLLNHTVEALKERGILAHCRTNRNGEQLAAELVIVPPELPQGARPPRLAIGAAFGPRGLSIDYTGSFPNAGADGGFGAEIGYDTIYTSELEQQILEFVRMATGA